MNTQELKLRAFEAVCANKEIHPTMILGEAQKAFEWIAKVENPAECTLSASADGIHFIPVLADFGAISSIIEKFQKAIVETDKQPITRFPADSPNVTNQTPEQVLRANGWESNGGGYYQKDGVIVFIEHGNWGVYNDAKGPIIPQFWSTKDGTFSDWLTSQVAELTTKTPEPSISNLIKSELSIHGWVRDPQKKTWTHMNSHCVLALNDSGEWQMTRQNGQEWVILSTHLKNQPFFEWLGKYIQKEATKPKTPEDVLRDAGWEDTPTGYYRKGNPNLWVAKVGDTWFINTVSGYPVSHLLWDESGPFADWLDEKIQYLNHVNGSPEKATPKSEAGKVETYQSYRAAVSQNLHKIQAGNPLWDGCPLVKRYREGAVYAGNPSIDGNLYVCLSSQNWATDSPHWKASYHLLRLDQNENFQVA